MCGIFGYSFKDGAISDGRRAILGNNLARLNDKRGGHSWGVCSIEPGNPEPMISRGLGDMADHAYTLADAKFLFAHCRWATVGAKTIENSHPFEIGNIIGAHNGGVANHNELDRKYKRDCKVDSQHFFHHLNDNVNFGDIEGYGTIEWVYKDDLSKIYLSRLKGGQLAIFGIGDPHQEGKTKGIVWTSDEKHLLEAMFTAGIKDFFPYKVEEGAVFFVQDGEIYIDHQRKLEIGREVHRKSQQWENNYGTYGGYTTRQTTGTGFKGGGTTGSTKSESIHSSPIERDLTDWREWNLYCEEKEGACEDNNCGFSQDEIGGSE